MLEQLIVLNNILYMLLNTAIANPALDSFFLVITNFGSLAFWLLLAPAFLIRRDKKSFIALSIAVILSSAAAYILKYLFAMPRPSSGRILVQETAPGFPSAHAANAFAGAAVLSKLHKGFTFALYALAVLVAISRVYIGAHYPLDIIAGSLIGIAIGLLVMRLPLDRMVNKLEKKLKGIKRKK
ncbi:MAG: phosphatase PAP2 family protein [Candidatus Aenigmatarchaeota archaeon]